MTTPVLAPLEFYGPPVNPSPFGLYPAVNWTENTGPTRFLPAGVRIRPTNYGGETAFGAWDADWCGEPGSGDTQVKDGVRPLLPEPFTPFTLWAYDSCDPSPGSRAEVLERVQQNFRLLEPVAAEMMFATAMMNGITEAPPSRDSVREALAYLEGQLAKTNTLGQIHASPEAASLEFGLVLPSGGALKTPLGHTWIFGGGYVDTLGNLLIATSPVFGWRDQVQVRPVLDYMQNTYAAIAERSVVLGYEKLVAAVYTDVTGS